jgi:hypothetical protein
MKTETNSVVPPTLKSWQQLTTLNNPTTRFSYTDSASSGVASRFYRVVSS